MTPTFATEPENGKQTLHTRLESWLNEVNPLSGIAQSQCSPSRQTPQLPECTQSCVVCGNEKTESKFPPRITSTCTHKPNTCKSCLRKWLASELESKGWDRISCPECRQTMQHADMQKHARKETFQRYDNLSTRATLSALPDFRWCLRPGCDSGQIHEITVEGPVFQCSSCGHLSCAVHNKAWHEGETCEQFDERKLAEPSQKRKEAEVSEKWKARNTKLCPGCRAPIQKNGGCSHMVCQHCSHDFDWKHAPAYTPPKVEPVVTASSPLGRPTSNLSKLSSLGRLINRTSTQRLYGSSLARASSPNPRRFTSRQDNLYV
ncbi:hypothetical protein K432DRAFT_354127 [Lepidopterella palustris CBS 459.81]|uniref:RBR-type E3 ubiquitin transferase n=1 Tax=Lepidopterella palustris CBS 459.81 TaxID=1314670 RepID=A0A8E2JEU0_9PEZI|nr:hypothetical protein K432DRAFT_354127 [Lepidopterella palustris CBS 459.81]